LFLSLNERYANHYEAVTKHFMSGICGALTGRAIHVAQFVAGHYNFSAFEHWRQTLALRAAIRGGDEMCVAWAIKLLPPAQNGYLFLCERFLLI